MLLAPVPSSLRRRELGPGCLGFYSFLSQSHLGQESSRTQLC